MTYIEQLKDPRWQKMRLKVLEYAGFRCQVCGDNKSTLHVHHSRYLKGKMAWQHPIGSLISVCEKHHAMFHPPKPKVQAIYPPLPDGEKPDECEDDDVAVRFARLRAMLNNPKP